MINPQYSSPVASARQSWFHKIHAALQRQACLFIDTAHWKSAETFTERLSAVSWPRVSVAASAMIFLIAGGVWLMLQSSGVRAHPPRLPTEQEWQATQPATAFEGELSPALAQANQSVPSEIR